MKIAVAMSGGVDSSITAVMLREMGHDIIGITADIMYKPAPSNNLSGYNSCISSDGIQLAREIAEQFGFSHHVVEIEDEFRNKIINPFCKEYLSGRTPSPCIHCNADIKFKKLMELAKSLGYEKLATGHYARLGHEKDRHYISMAHDREKDQSYFLFRLEQDILADVLFPLGNCTKKEIVEVARNHRLSVAEREESQEICFVPGNNYAEYINNSGYAVPPPGDILDTNGNILGRHRGIHHYTIGQRRGLGISAERPLYVIEIDAERNILVAGAQEQLYREGLIAKNISYMKETSLNGKNGLIKTRSTQTPFPANIDENDGYLRILFKDPQPGITPGQAVVVYSDGGEIMGGAWIEKSF